MTEPSTNARPDTGPYVAVFVAQLVLTGLAVLVSRLEDLGTTLVMAAVMLVALVNGGMVALFTMGLRRDGRVLLWSAMLVVVLVAGLLAWPAWDIYERARRF